MPVTVVRLAILVAASLLVCLFTWSGRRFVEMRRRQAGMLSGGQQQQLAIGRALVSRPRLLILDEPTEGIQPSLVIEVRRALREVRERLQVAILLAEQFMDFAQDLADEFCVLDAGGIALRGSAAAIDRAAVSELLSV